VLKESCSLFPDKFQGVFLEAEWKLSALNSIDLGDKRSFIVGESLLWTGLCEVRFSAQVAAAVSVKAAPKGFSTLAAVTKDAAAIRYANNRAAPPRLGGAAGARLALLWEALGSHGIPTFWSRDGTGVAGAVGFGGVVGGSLGAAILCACGCRGCSRVKSGKSRLWN
jgi:hypothetical protein